MQTTVKLYTDIDYESFPIADLDLDLHWIQLPNSVLAARRQAKLLALAQARESSADRAQSIPGPRRPVLRPHRKTSTPSLSGLTAPSASPSLNCATSTAAGATPSPPTSKCPPHPKRKNK